MPAYFLELAVVALGLLLLMLEAFAGKGDRHQIAWIAMAGLGAVLVASFFAEQPANAEGGLWSHYTRFFTSEPGSLAIFYKQLALLATIIVTLMSTVYAPVISHYTSGDEKNETDMGEYLCLPVFACAGMMWMASAKDLISIFVSIELTTICFYVLVSYMRRNVGSLEAGVKYLILGALSTGFLVYGITWIFGLTGQTELSAIGAALAAGEVSAGGPLLFGLALFLVGLGFKVGAVPFQIWIPDVYQGAPTPTTAFLSVGSKAAGFIVLMRVLEPFLEASALHPKLVLILTIIAAATILYGSLAAIPQSNFKRLLAYSSISHAGFLLMAIACWPAAPGEPGDLFTPKTVVSFYLGTYLLMALLCFLVLALVRSQLQGEDLDTFNGLAKRSPLLAFATLIGVIALAGVPLTAGFFGKFFVFLLAVREEQFVLLAIAVAGAAAGFYYYFKVIRSMYWNEPDGDAATIVVSLPARAAIIALIAAVIFFGVYPTPILNLLG